MPVLSSIFLVIALTLAVMVGPQLRPWTWGPAMLALGISAMAAIPAFWKRDKVPADLGLVALGTVVVGWFVWRAWVSPVQELGQADLLLAAGIVATFISIRAIEGHALAERVLIWGIALLLLANVGVAIQQITDPSFSPVFRDRVSINMVSGFYSHYNEAANYFVASSMLVGAAALFGRHSTATRIVWILIALGGLVCVWYSRSRGGILAMALACAVFAIVAAMIGKRRNSRWFAPSLIAIPLIGLGLGLYLFLGWQDAQEARDGDTQISVMFDNISRLLMFGAAVSCIALHPLAGGGSRSYSWECFQFFEGKEHGPIVTRKPEQVHNELLQAATDYGLIGAGLLIILLLFLAVMVIVRILFENSEDGQRRSKSAWRLGATAALAGMLVQSCFSFVFHLMPGALLLGICLGMMAGPSSTGFLPGKIRIMGPKILLSVSSFACALGLLSFGWKGTRITQVLWPVFFSKQAAASPETRIDALSEAIHVWPQTEFLRERAGSFRAMADSDEGRASGEDFKQSAIEDYQRAAMLHPFEPSFPVNQANLLSETGRYEEAELLFARAIRLQGGMEAAFRARFSQATHFLRKGLELLNERKTEEANMALEAAAEQFETAVIEMHGVTSDMVEPRVLIHEGLGAARETAGDREGALEAYDFAVTLYGGERVHYRAGVLLGTMAAEAWTQRKPSVALGYFIKARARIAMATQLPHGVSPSKKVEYLAYLDQTIAFLKGAKIEPED